jgi:hypothetical protein
MISDVHKGSEVYDYARFRPIPLTKRARCAIVEQLDGDDAQK